MFLHVQPEKFILNEIPVMLNLCNSLNYPSSQFFIFSLKKKFELLFGDKLEVLKTNQVCYIQFTVYVVVKIFCHVIFLNRRMLLLIRKMFVLTT